MITRILLRKQHEQHYYRNFYARRVLRLAPSYLLILLLVAVLVRGSGGFLLLSLVYLAIFFALFHVPMMYGPLWSLSVKKHLYLLWPSLIRFGADRLLLFFSIALCLFCPALRLYKAFHGSLDEYLSWYRFDGIMGCASRVSPRPR